MSVPSKVELWMYLDGSSKLALSIRLMNVEPSPSPLKWLRFLGFVIYGRQGYISVSTNGPELDYTENIEARSYHFISDGNEPRFIDVDAMGNKTQSTSASEPSTRKRSFRQVLISRDGTCAMTGVDASFCEGCHLIPRSKGDSVPNCDPSIRYMSNLFDHRGEMYGPVDPLDDIDDPRNGILLFTAFHGTLGAGYIAFLKTPNFALTVDDIPCHQSSNAGSPNRLTLQHIQPSQSVIAVLGQLCPHNTDARQPQDISQWPPAIIVDLAYAVAALQAWGPEAFIEDVRANSREAYYDYAGDMEGDDGEDAPRDPTSQEPHQPTPRTIRYEKRSAGKALAVNPADELTPGRMDMYDVVFSLWVRSAKEARDERRVPGSGAADVADKENKVETWLQSTKRSTS
ncbi:hypothetical protein HD554DRAFT_2197886 [Boletus coccyginus]|nr:hypothetical protein HD554DRAFT_2197886 [Boletus coccyginus]